MMARGAQFLRGAWRDLAYAGRSLSRARAFTVVCVVSLGIGIAPAIAIPYVARLFTTPPSGIDTDRLVEVVTTPQGPTGADDEWSWPDYEDVRNAATGTAIAGWAPGEVNVSRERDGDSARARPALFVSDNYFDVLELTLARGPGFSGTDEPVVVISDRFWRDQLDGDPGVLGTMLTLDGLPHAVAGIAPGDFTGHLAFHEADLFVPLDRHPLLVADEGLRIDRSRTSIRLLGGLAPGTSLAQAGDAIAAITTQLAGAHPATNEFRIGTVAPYHAVGALESTDLRIFQLVWQTMATLPLLVVCLNISAMVQVRSALRERELSIRQAIGASRGRLVRQLLAEAVLLAMLGGALASIVMFNMPPVISWMTGEPIPPRWEDALRVDASILAVCVGASLATSVVFGLLPALRFSRPAIITVLKDETGVGGRRVGRAHRVTAALQVALAVPLLVMSAMSLDRVRATATSHLGFDADLLYAAPLALDGPVDGPAGVDLRGMASALAGASGVEAVTVADGLPLDFRYRVARVALETAPGEAATAIATHVTRVGDGYLDTMGIPLLVGRPFGADDGAGAQRVAIIAQALAVELFPDADGDAGAALGQRVVLRYGDDDDDDQLHPPLVVVGVTADFPTSQMSTERPQLLLPLAQHPGIRADSVPVNDDLGGGPTLMLIARAAGGVEAGTLTAALERAVREVDPDFDATRIVAGTWLRRNSMRDFLTQSAVSGISGGVVLLLAGLGLFGVVGMMVATRTREIAVRVVLGASRRRVIGMVLRDVLRLIAPGVAVGLVVAVALVRVNGGLLGLSLSRLEPMAYVVGAALAVLVALSAGLGPARRAASVEPMVAMRAE